MLLIAISSITIALLVGVFELDELVGWPWWNGSYPRSDAFLWWWLVLFIEAPVLFPNIEQEGIPQQRDLKGDNQYRLSRLKVVFAYQRLW